MKAIVLKKYGPPSILRLRELAKPVPGDNEVLVKVHATAVNDWDWCYIRGRPRIYRLMFGLFKPRFRVMGVEVAGIIEAVGERASAFRPGDRVYGDISAAGFGGFAEYVCVPQDALHAMSPYMNFEEAAALPHAAMLALQGLVDVGRIRPGEQVLINGAGGGVGTLGVQIAKQYGAEVTGVDSALKLDTLRDLGFDHAIDYQVQDFTEFGQRYDLILDTRTNRSPFRYLRALRPGGRYVTVGGNLLRLLQLSVMARFISIFSDKRVQIAILKPNKDLAYINDLFETRGLRCVIDGPYPLSDVPRAIQRFGEALHIGKVVISVTSQAPEQEVHNERDQSNNSSD